MKYGMTEESMKVMKQMEIIDPIRESMAIPDSNRSAFRQIVLRAAATAHNCAKQFYFAEPKARKNMLDSIKDFIAKCRAPEKNRTVKERDSWER